MCLTTSLPVSIPSKPPKQICDSSAQSRLGFAITKLVNPEVPIKPIIRSDVAIALRIGMRVINNKAGTIKSFTHNNTSRVRSNHVCTRWAYPEGRHWTLEVMG